ncbi:MAG: hypothetical protein WAK97_20530, partial [Pseudolabrys sp.]
MPEKLIPQVLFGINDNVEQRHKCRVCRGKSLLIKSLHSGNRLANRNLKLIFFSDEFEHQKQKWLSRADKET